MRTTVEIKGWDGYIVGESLTRTAGELDIYSQYMSICVAIDLYNEGIVDRVIAAEKGGCVVTVDVDRVSRIYPSKED